MRSWMLITMLAAGLMLELALASPLNLDDIQDTPETDEQLLKLLGGQSMEDVASSGEQEHLRVRRKPIEDPDPEHHHDCHSHSHAHPDELAHELHGHKHAGRERRDAGEDSSGSAEEKHKGGDQEKEHDVVVDEQEKQTHVAGEDSSGASNEKGQGSAPPARFLRAAVGEDSSGSSEEADKAKVVGQEQPEPKKQEEDASSSEEKPKRRKRSDNYNYDEATVPDYIDGNADQDYN